MKKVIIIGGGISGLTVAHELSELGYDITILERNDIVGGIARTYQNEEKKVCPIEYSWRAYGRWYQNVYDIMKKIPFNNKEYVYDQLTELEGGKKTCNKSIPQYSNTLNLINVNDKFKIFPIVIQYLFSCKQKNIETFSKIGLRDFIKKFELSKDTEDVIGKIVGPYLGFDYHNASVYDLLYFGEMNAMNSDNQYNFNITKYPTNYAWFDPWVNFLKKKGVKIHTNNEVKNIIIKDSKIECIYVKNNKNISKKIADYYVNCTGPEIFEKLLRPYNNIFNNYYSKIFNVKNYGYQIQLSIYYYIDRKVFLEKNNRLAYLPNTPWLLMVLPTGHIWGDKYLKKFCDPKIKEVISVGICEPYVKGNLIKKPWSKCTISEIRAEAWNQLINDKDFKNNVCIENDVDVQKINIIDFKMWHSYKYDGIINTYEPKWANNVNTAKYRPTSISPIKNLVVAGAYTDTSTGTFSMESACESGKIAAKTVCKIDNKNENIYLHTKKKIPLFEPIRYINKITYRNNLLLSIFIIIVIIFIIFYLYKSKKYKLSIK